MLHLIGTIKDLSDGNDHLRVNSTLSVRLSARAGMLCAWHRPPQAACARRVLPPLRLLCTGVPVYGIRGTSPERHYVVRHASHNWGWRAWHKPAESFHSEIYVCSTRIYRPVASSSLSLMVTTSFFFDNVCLTHSHNEYSLTTPFSHLKLLYFSNYWPVFGWDGLKRILMRYP